MRSIFSPLVLGFVVGLGIGVVNSRADLEVSGSVQIHATTEFYEPLSPHGTWIEVGSYGRCWHPARVAVEWRPYCDGHWVWTDYGWYWVSDEPWAWACYHYGSWVYDPAYGWVWAPGIEWAPAWVSWRVGGGYIGWAPLPPRGVVIAGLPAPPFIFVETHRFRESLKPATVIVNNTTVLNKTTVINNIRQETRTVGSLGPRKVMVNEGPGLEPIQKATGKKVSVVPMQDVAKQTPVPPVMTRNRTDFKEKVETPLVKPIPREPGRKVEQIAPVPERPSIREAPPAQPFQSSGGKGRGKGHGKD